MEGWSRQRRAIVLHRRLRGAVALSHDDGSGVAQLSFAEIGEATDVYEYSVLVTSLDAPVESSGQLNRDRGDGEPSFRDSKDLRSGMGMSVLRVSGAQRRDRRVWLNAFAMLFLTLLSPVGESLGMDRQLRTSTVKRRVHSLFLQGCLLYELITNIPDERLRPLIERYQELLRQNTVFSEAFGLA